MHQLSKELSGSISESRFPLLAAIRYARMIDYKGADDTTQLKHAKSDRSALFLVDMSSTSTDKKIILVFGATGVQGFPVVDALLAPSPDGSPSPYAIRALTRDPDNYRAKALAAKGVELVKGEYMSSSATLYVRLMDVSI